MRFKDFEIRPYTDWDGSRSPDKYEIVKWYKTDEPIEVLNARTNKKEMQDTFCYMIAFIDYNPKEPCWELRSVGTRFLEDYENGLCEFVRSFIKVLDVCKENEDETD